MDEGGSPEVAAGKGDICEGYVRPRNVYKRGRGEGTGGKKKGNRQGVRGMGMGGGERGREGLKQGIREGGGEVR